jgi:hypothetical protein
MDCGVCFHEFDVADHEPLVLPCGHSFCKSCVEGLPTKHCPNCRKQFNTTQKNFVVLDIIQSRVADRGSVGAAGLSCQTTENLVAEELLGLHEQMTELMADARGSPDQGMTLTEAWTGAARDALRKLRKEDYVKFLKELDLNLQWLDKLGSVQHMKLDDLPALAEAINGSCQSPDGGRAVEAAPRARGEKRCRCGSTRHLQTTHASCPLNPRNSAPAAGEAPPAAQVQRRGEVRAEHGSQAVVAALRAHPTNVDVQKQGCEQLWDFARYSEEDKVRIGEAGGCQAVVAALRAHPTNADVQRNGCWALRSLANNDENRVRIGEAGGCQAVVAALRAHPTNAGVQESGCGALWSLARRSEENKVRIGEAGGCQAVIAALRAHPTNAGLQRSGCWALANLANNNDENEVRIGEAGGCQAVVAALRAHPTKADLRKFGSKLLKKYGVKVPRRR